MRRFIQLAGIGVAGGAVLAALMQLIHAITGNDAYILLYNVDYWPVIHVFQHVPGFGLAFHFVFCIASVIGLYYVLALFGWQYSIWAYAAVYTAGSGILYFLTLLTELPPSADDPAAWAYWTASHFVYSLVVAELIIRFVRTDGLKVGAV
ncbi:hypothetical protein NCCP2716_21940 [Sporosarcina sp. NCCP-2716]|uniref:hypothetical protein n=1 Tax=Sporosarcina sp. NCCP-2716 TaxID=2943679 RepID=UPI00203FA2E2|nr:hypothetical protein [Sporosarcina sp. NCCP-2716]GKV69696.1 hypothetical protein NCCP2716_21940 [Sporosarcina sp. NCCP-2716]